MKKAITTIIAMILVILITIVAASAAYYWLGKVQSEMQAGTSMYEAELTGYVSGRIHVVDFQFDTNTKNAKIIVENSGSRKLESIGSKKDAIVITSKTTSCDIAFNSSYCDACPFDLDVRDIREINIDFAGSGCKGLAEGTEYKAFFALEEGQALASFIPTAGVYDEWAQKYPASKPSARWMHAMAAVDGTDNVVLFGGVSINAETWVYDLSDNTWTQKFPASKPSGRYGHAMATVDGTDNVVLFGGYDESGNCDGSGSSYCNGTWVYDLSADTWTQKSPASKPNSRYAHAMAAVYNDDKVVLFGGYNGTEIGETWVYDSSDDDWTLKSPASKPSDREYPAMATIYGDDKVVLFGGIDAGGYDDETWVYDLSDDAWTQKSPASKPSGRYSHGMATVDGTDQVVLFGGYDSSALNDETWVYDLSADTWTQKSPASKPSARDLSAMAAVDGTDQVVLFGGQESGNLKNDETWIFT